MRKIIEFRVMHLANLRFAIRCPDTFLDFVLTNIQWKASSQQMLMGMGLLKLRGTATFSSALFPFSFVAPLRAIMMA